MFFGFLFEFADFLKIEQRVMSIVMMSRQTRRTNSDEGLDFVCSLSNRRRQVCHDKPSEKLELRE